MKLNKNLAYIIGVYLGDGYISKVKQRGKYVVYRIMLQVEDYDFAEKFNLNIANFLKRNPTKIYQYKMKTKFSTVHRNRVEVSSRELCEWIIEQTKNKKIIPSLIKKASIKNKKEFVQGIMDSEGSISLLSEGKIKNKPYYIIRVAGIGGWFNELPEILNSIGLINGGIKKNWHKINGYYMNCININAKSYKNIGLNFIQKRKQDQLSKVTEWGKP